MAAADREDDAGPPAAPTTGDATGAAPRGSAGGAGRTVGRATRPAGSRVRGHWSKYCTSLPTDGRPSIMLTTVPPMLGSSTATRLSPGNDT